MTEFVVFLTSVLALGLGLALGFWLGYRRGVWLAVGRMNDLLQEEQLAAQRRWFQQASAAPVTEGPPPTGWPFLGVCPPPGYPGPDGGKQP